MSLHDAVAKYVENGDVLATGGFTTNRKPYAAVSEILRQGQKDFIVYAGPGGGEVDMLIGEGRVAAYINCYTANSGYTNVSRRFRAAIEKGQLTYEDYSQDVLMLMLHASSLGLPFLPVRLMQGSAAVVTAQQSGNWVAMQGLELLAMLVAAAMGAVFSLLLSFASINLRADQTIGGTALNLMAPALVLFLVRIIANQNTLQLATGDSATWFMIRKSTFGIDKNTDLGFFGETFLVKVYLATYVCIILFVILSIIL